MKVKDLIDELQKMPQDAEVLHLWDGEARTVIEHVWLSNGGNVITADHDMVCYSTKNRPIDAPTMGDIRYWRTPESDEK